LERVPSKAFVKGSGTHCPVKKYFEVRIDPNGTAGTHILEVDFSLVYIG
jgi:hypothetical protein